MGAGEQVAGVVLALVLLGGLGNWNVRRWRALGWESNDGGPGEVSKRFDGSRLSASIDVGKGTGYAIVVSQDGGGLCT